jgi:hypothetical protein
MQPGVLGSELLTTTDWKFAERASRATRHKARDITTAAARRRHVPCVIVDQPQFWKARHSLLRVRLRLSFVGLSRPKLTALRLTSKDVMETSFS